MEIKNISKYCKVVDLEDIKANDYNLNITRYIDSFDGEEDFDLKIEKRDIDKLETDREKLKREIDRSFGEIKV